MLRHLVHGEDAPRPHRVLLQEGEQPRVLLRLLGHAQDGDLLAGAGVAQRDTRRALGRAAVARDGVAVRAGGRVAEQVVDAIGDPFGQRVLQVMRLLIGLGPAQAHHLGQQPLAEGVAAKVRSAVARPASVSSKWRVASSTVSSPRA